ncbi:MAG: TonB-dependent receptor [Bryobacteraceae bacterium]|nr:TonB-dependent receptor [Bryobacteraceae bacterium]
MPLEAGGEDYRLDLLFRHFELRTFIVAEVNATVFRPEYASKNCRHRHDHHGMCRHVCGIQTSKDCRCRVNMTMSFMRVSTRTKVIQWILLLGAGLGCVDFALPQATKAELFGTVRDPAGMPVDSAVVELINAGTQVQARLNTSPIGEYHFFALPPGSYQLAVTKPGFAVLKRDGVVLRVGDQVGLDLTLQIGDLSQAVEVTAEAPLLQAARGTVRFTVEEEKVANLPLDGRNFVPLIALSPGVNLPPGSTLPRINGSRPRVSEYIYDGISVLQPEPGQVAYFPIIDAIEEFRVEANSYSAEYGRANGGVIMVNQKSGGNDLHGTLFEFLRNEALNARNLFAPAGPKPRFRRNQYGFVLGGPIQRNRTFFFVDWQGTRLENGTVRTSTVPTSAQRSGRFAIPIYDPATTRLAESAYTRSPFPGNTIPSTRFDAATRRVLSRYPVPNVFTGSGAEATANNYRRVGNEDVSQDQSGTRLDRYFGSRHRLFGRYTYLRDFSRPVTPLPEGSGNIASGVVGDTLTRADSVVAEHNWTIGATRANQVRFGYTRRGFCRSSLRTGRPASDVSGIPNIPASSFADTLPTYDIVGYQLLGPPANGNAVFTTSVTQFIDNLTWVSNRHSLKFGTDIRRQTLDVLQPSSPTGNFQFTNLLTAGLSSAGTPLPSTGDSIASLLLGQVQQFRIDVQKEVLQPRATIAEFYLQDDFRANRRLSLNLGVRYTLNFPSTVVNDRGAVFNLRTQQLDFLGQNGLPRTARNLELGNFGPRVGLAFRVSDSFAIRAGYGMTWIEQAGITTPFTTPLFPFVRTVQQTSLDNINPAFVLSQGPTIGVDEPNSNSGLGQGVFGVQRDQKSGYAQQWNLSVQKTFGENWSIAVGYLGSKLTNLGVPDVNLNQLRADQLALGSQLTELVSNPFFGEIPIESSLGRRTIARQQLLRPFPRFTTVTLYRNNVGHSTYHSLQSLVEKRLAQGLTFSAAYTFSRLIDDAGAVFDAAILTGPVTSYQAADSYNRRLEKDVSTGNIPHILSSGFIYELPIGLGRRFGLRGWRDVLGGRWRLAGLLRAQSGSPIAVTQQPNLNAFAGFGIQRPNRLRDPNLPADQRSTAHWFNTSAFTAARQFAIGNSSRNPVRGPGYRTIDLMAGKTFTVTERFRTEFRAEAFNVTNTPPLRNPNGAFGTAAFGTITTALDPRVFEFVLKLQF